MDKIEISNKLVIYNRIVKICYDYEHDNEPVIINNINQGLYSDLNLDSLAVVEIVMLCEKEFAIRIEDEEIVKLKTVDDLVNLIDKIYNDNARRNEFN